jgi:uncharacterized protein (DUF1697 family)
MVLSADELQRAANGNPFATAVDNPAALHLFFLEANPKSPDLKALEALKTKTEAFALKGTIFYLHTPDGLGRSKLATRIERSLGVQGTARNWRTVTTLLGMLNESAD